VRKYEREFLAEPPKEKKKKEDNSLFHLLWSFFLSANLLHVLIVHLGGVLLPEGGLGMDMHTYHPGGGKKETFPSSRGAY